MDFPYYTLQDGFQSTLNLVSDSPHPIDLSIVLYGALGHSAIAPPFTIQPEQKLALDLGQLLGKMGLDPAGEFAEGSIAVMFMGTIMPVVGQVTIQNPASHLAHEAEMVENDPGRSDIPAVLDGLWWGLGGGRDARIVVANMGSQQVTADIYLDYGGERHASSPLIFAPHELKTLSVTQLLGALGASPAEVPAGGITIIGHSLTPSLLAQGNISDPVTGFSTTLRFPGAETQPANALHASGVPIGTPTTDSPFAGMGDFVPHLALRNLLSVPQQVTVTVEYPQPATVAPASSPANSSPPSPPAESGNGGNAATATPTPHVITAPPQPGDANDHPEWGPGTGATVGTVTLAPITVAGQSTVDFSFAAVMNELPLPLPFVSIRVQYSGQAGSMVAELASVDQQQDLVIDSKFQNEGWGWAGSGANPWHLDNQTESILFLTNESGQSTGIGFVVTAKGIHFYLAKLRLQPHETRVINLRSLRDAQAADFKQNKIPADAADGSVSWIRFDNVPVEGRLVVIERQGGVASNYDCCICACPASDYELEVTPYSVNLTTGQSAQFQAADWKQNCNGAFFYAWWTDSVPWTSSAFQVASVTSTGYVTAADGGSSTISASTVGMGYTWNSYNGCQSYGVPLYGSGTVNVLFPKSLSIVAGTSSTTKEVTCPVGSSTGCGVTRSFTYQVLDQFGNSLTGSWIATQQFWDAIQVTSPKGLGGGSFVTTCTGKMGPPVNGVDPGTNHGPCGFYVSSSGRIAEKGLSICSTACYAKGTCVTAGYTGANQTIHIGSYSIVQHISYYCDHVLVNGL